MKQNMIHRPADAVILGAGMECTRYCGVSGEEPVSKAGLGDTRPTLTRPEEAEVWSGGGLCRVRLQLRQLGWGSGKGGNKVHGEPGLAGPKVPGRIFH